MVSKCEHFWPEWIIILLKEKQVLSFQNDMGVSSSFAQSLPDTLISWRKIQSRYLKCKKFDDTEFCVSWASEKDSNFRRGTRILSKEKCFEPSSEAHCVIFKNISQSKGFVSRKPKLVPARTSKTSYNGKVFLEESAYLDSFTEGWMDWYKMEFE